MSVKIGRIRGINIKLDYSWFLVFLFIIWSLAHNYLPSQYPDKPISFYWIIGGVSALSLYLSVLVHELAHSTVAENKGLDISNITLYFFGGVSQIDEESTDPDTEAYMAIVGPITSMVIGGLFLVLYYTLGTGAPDAVDAVLMYSGYVNIMLAFFNMIPAFPMDGGRVFRAILWKRSGNLIKSTRTASTVSNVISVIFMGIGLFSIFSTGSFNGLWLIFIGLFINGSSKMGLSQTIISEALGKMTVREIMTKEVRTIDPDASIQRAIDEWFSVHKHQGYPVVENGELVGIVTIEDVRNVDPKRRDSVRVRDVMKTRGELVTISPDEKASDALMLMSSRNVGRLPVVEGGKLVGIITRSDIGKTIQIRSKI